MSYGLIHRHTVIGSGGGGSDQLAEFADGTISVFNDPTITRITRFRGMFNESCVSNITAISLPNCTEIIGAPFVRLSSAVTSLNLLALKSFPSFNSRDTLACEIGRASTTGALSYLSTYNVLGFSNGWNYIESMYFRDLSYIWVTAVGSIGTAASIRGFCTPFAGLGRLKDVYIMSNSVVTISGSVNNYQLGAAVAFIGTGLRSVFVPMSLLSDYKNDVYWSTITNNLVGV